MGPQWNNVVDDTHSCITNLKEKIQLHDAVAINKHSK